MSEFKGTKGPWYEKQFGGRQIGGAEGYAICTMWGKTGEPEDDANARLIAAAPDLLEALIAAQRYCEHCGGNQTARGLPHPQELLMTKIANSISKALQP